MTPEQALERQIEAYRRMTGQQRLQIPLRMHELSCQVARCGIRSQFPDADEDEVDRKLRRRSELARRILDGEIRPKQT